MLQVPVRSLNSGGRIRTSDLRVMSVISSKSELFVKSITYGHRAVYDDAPQFTRVPYLPCFSIGSVRASVRADEKSAHFPLEIADRSRHARVSSFHRRFSVRLHGQCSGQRRRCLVRKGRHFRFLPIQALEDCPRAPASSPLGISLLNE